MCVIWGNMERQEKVLKPWEERRVPYHGVWWSLHPQWNKNSSTANSCLRPLSPQLWAYTVPRNLTRKHSQENCTLFSPGTSAFTLSECGSTQGTSESLDNLIKQNGGVRKSFPTTFEVKLESHCGSLNQNGSQRLISGGGIIGGVALWE